MGRKKKVIEITEEEVSQVTDIASDEHVEITPEPEALAVVKEDQTPEQMALAPLSKYDVELAAYEEFKTFKINGPTDKAGYKIADASRLKVKRSRLEAKDAADMVVKPFKDAYDKVNGLRKSLITRFEEIEDHLEAETKIYKAQLEELEKKQIEEANAKLSKRIEQLITLGAKHNGLGGYEMGEFSVSGVELRSLPDEDFIDITSAMETENQRVRDEENARIEAEKVEKERLKKEAAAQKKESDRLTQANAVLLAKLAELEAKIEADRIAKEEEELIRSQNEQIDIYNKRYAAREQELKELGIEVTDETINYRDHSIGWNSDLDMNDESWADFITSLPHTKLAIDENIAQVKETVEQVIVPATAAEVKESAQVEASSSVVIGVDTREADGNKVKEFGEKFTALLGELPEVFSEEAREALEVFEVDVYHCVDIMLSKIGYSK